MSVTTSVEVQHLGLQHVLAAEGEELAGQGSGALAGVQDRSMERTQLMAVRQTRQHHFAVAR